jgi:NAD(P)-dependent dehydrogenase (short-subunit alcohol dehydrogenase family)
LASNEDWQQVMDVNLRAAVRLSARLIPGMAARGGGSVVLMSSIAGLRGNRAIGLYGLSKAALAQLARNLAVEWGPQGVRVNAVSPGLVRTPLATQLMADEAFMKRRIQATPLRRVGEPQEIAAVVLMLASPAGGFITGQNLVVDGGTTISDGS